MRFVYEVLLKLVSVGGAIQGLWIAIGQYPRVVDGHWSISEGCGWPLVNIRGLWMAIGQYPRVVDDHWSISKGCGWPLVNIRGLWMNIGQFPIDMQGLWMAIGLSVGCWPMAFVCYPWNMLDNQITVCAIIESNQE